VEFRILGPLEVGAGDAVLALRGRRQRALLAILVLHANEVVSAERLIDDLWGADAPESGIAALQVRVSQLRRALETHGPDGSADAIRTQHPGYLLRAAPDQIDARRFGRLLAGGRALAAESEPERAAQVLREALDLWRGPALADFAYEPFAQPEIARLEELRLAALEERIAADLALGRHAELTGELEALVADHPLRERLRAQHMLALYRNGRQADALAVYRDTRSSLVEQLGIEPGEELRHLEQAILRQDPNLAPPRARPPRRSERPPVIEERKVVTVVFVDLVGSTELVLEADPERTRALLDRYYEAMAFEIDTAGGTVEKFVGDAVLAVFGAPVAQEDHAERALHAALAMRRRMSELFGDQLSLRVGLATGEVVVGRARAGGAFVTGVAVNVAERLQRAAAPGEILVTARTARAAGGVFELGPPTVVEAKGIPEGVECRNLVRALSLTQSRGRRGLGSVFVGREHELDVLRASYRRTVERGSPSLLTVVGDAGVGKSRLLREWWDWLAEASPAPVRRASRCFPAGKRVTFGPLRDVLREEFGLLMTDPPDLARQRLGDREILGLALGLDIASDLHPLAARERLREAWVDLLDELVSERPAVLLVEDIHWAQDLLLELLEAAARDVRGPLLIVVTARPELADERPAWAQGQRDAATIRLDPLSAEESAVLFEQLLCADPQPALRDLLVERTEGNPFFAEELLERLLDEGLITCAHGRCQLHAPLEEIPLPDSVQSVVAARLDLLPPTEKAAIQAASVIGRVFWRGPVRALLDDSPPDFSVLEARDFIRRRPVSSVAGEREYAFKHALTRDVAYASLPKSRRARLHAAFASWLEQTGGGRDEDAPTLALHYSEAVRPEDADLAWREDPGAIDHLTPRALEWLRRASELAMRRYEIDEAIDLLQRALELEPSPEGRCELLRRIARANALKFDGEAMWTAMLDAIGLTDDPGIQAELYAELAFQSACRSGIWKRMPDAAVVDGWIDRALALAEPQSRSRALALVARGFWNPFESDDAAAEAHAIAKTLGDLELESIALEARGVTEAVAGRHEHGRALVESRFEFLDRISDPDHRADIYAAPISGCVWAGDFAEARRLARMHDVTTAPLTPHHRVHGVAMLGEVEELLGGWERICELEERTLATVEANADTPCVRNARALLVCAVAQAVRSDPERATWLEERADALGIEGYGLVLDTPRLRLALARGDLAAAERLLSTGELERGWYHGWMALSTVATRLDGLAAIRDAARLEKEATPCLRQGTYFEPFALRALGVVREDEGMIEQAAGRFEALGLEWHAGQTRALR
jgi:DNA-binding SARP family transcriptional activator